MDGLSKLPDDIIHLILSKLETRDVVRTSIVSKSWLDQWKTVPSLNFEIKTIDVEEIRNFIDTFLMRWNGTAIQIFKIRSQKFFDGLPSLFDDIRRWIDFAIARDVEELQISLHHTPPLYVLPPQCLYSCSSIRKLTLSGCDCRTSSDVHLDQLRTLRMDGCEITDDTINRIVSGSPKLETFKLFVTLRPHNVSIESTSLKILEIGSTSISGPSNDTMLSIRAPKLEQLSIYGPAYKKCWVKDTLSLTKVELLFTEENATLMGETLSQILPAIRHVQGLNLSFYCFKVLILSKWSSILFPFPFPNVKYLEYYCNYPIKLEYLAGFLETFPKLERLIMHWDPEYFVNFENWSDVVNQLPVHDLKNFGSQLKDVHIIWHNMDISLFEFIGSFLKHATEVRKLVVKKIWGNNKKSIWIRLGMARLRRSFPNVKLILVPNTSSRSERMNELPFLVKKLEVTMKKRDDY